MTGFIVSVGAISDSVTQGRRVQRGSSQLTQLSRWLPAQALTTRVFPERGGKARAHLHERGKRPASAHKRRTPIL
jgi:hypothetical protein